MIGFTFEKRWQWPRFLCVYLLTGVAASLLSCAASPESVSVGARFLFPSPVCLFTLFLPVHVFFVASGSLFGLLGADCSYLYMNWSQIPSRANEVCFLVMLIVINLLFGFTSNASDSTMQGNVDNFAHIGTCAFLSHFPQRFYEHSS